jgi:hypothetical protein
MSPNVTLSEMGCLNQPKKVSPIFRIAPIFKYFLLLFFVNFFVKRHLFS